MKYSLLAGLVSACTLAAQSSIEGHVFNSLSGAPLRKANVVLTAPTSEIRLVANTDAEGKFEFIGLPPGTYRVSASRSGFVERPTRRPIQLGPNNQVTDAEIRLPPQSVIAGRVLDEDSEPVDRARIAVFKQTYRNGSRQWDRLGPVSETNDAGEYRLTNLTPGRYLLQAYNTRPQNDNRFGDPPKMFYVWVYYPNVLSQEQALPVSVAAGAELRGIDIHLFKISRPPTVRIRGRVTGLQADSPVIVSFAADGAFFGGSTSAGPPDYAFELSAPPGQYTISANVYSGGQEAYGRALLTVTGEVDGVVLAMNPAPHVTGRISMAESGAKVNLQGVRIAMTRLSSSQISEVRSDAAGKFVLPKPFPPGHYAIVNVRSIPEGCFISEVKFGEKAISWDDFEISGSSQLEIILSNTAGKIAGSVLDADGKPVLGSSVTLIPTDEKSRPARESVADDGNFQFTNLRPGKYKLFAWEEVDDDLWQDPEFRKNYESLAAEITVGPSETQNTQLRVIAADAMK
jgi:hypothetical protein